MIFLVLAAVALTTAAEEPEAWQRFVTPVMSAGMGGTAYFPAEFIGGTPVEILDPGSFEVRMTAAYDPGDERVELAGEPFSPPRGRWRVWLEDASAMLMTPFSDLVVFAARRGAGVSPRMLPVAPAGRVGLGAEVLADPQGELWLLAADGYDRGYEMSRRRSINDLGDGVLMPAGTVLAAVSSAEERERLVALSRPFALGARETRPAPLEHAPAGRSWLLAYVERPPHVGPAHLADLEMIVSRNGEDHPAEFRFATPWGMYGAWYDLPPGEAIFTAGNLHLYLPSQPIELASGEIVRTEGTLVERSSLDVGLVLPSWLRQGPLELSVARLPGGEEMARAELPATAGRHRFDGLVQGPVEVVLDSRAGPFRRRVDLTGVREGAVTLAPRLIEFEGLVRLGGETHAATVELQTGGGDLVKVQTDDEGSYRATVLQAVRWATVALAGVEQEPWQEFFAPAIGESRELDFDIPAVDVKVRVVDSATGRGIAGAAVAVRNTYRPSTVAEAGVSQRSQGRRPEQVLGRSHTTGEDGWVRLPPPRPGELELTASADGYLPQDGPVVLEVSDPPADGLIELLLERMTEPVVLRLTLPDGSPAAGAEVMRVASLTASEQSLFSAHADVAGIVQVPREPFEGLLLLRHAAAASGFLDWPEIAGHREIDWTFESAVSRPLAVRVLDAAGEELVAGAEITLWSGGRRLTGWLLRWLLDAPPRSDGSGFWIARRLPRGDDVAVVASESPLVAEGEALRGLGTEFSFPWRETVTIRIIR